MKQLIERKLNNSVKNNKNCAPTNSIHPTFSQNDRLRFGCTYTDDDRKKIDKEKY